MRARLEGRSGLHDDAERVHGFPGDPVPRAHLRFDLVFDPEGRIAEYLGVYGITGKFSSLFGPLIWGLITLRLESLGMMRYRVALAVLICFIVAGLVYLGRVRLDD